MEALPGIRCKSALAGLLVVAVGLTGCEEEPAPESPAEAPAAPTSTAPEEKPAPTAVITEPTFRLALEDLGDEGVALKLEAKGGYHINQEFPFQATLSSPSAGLVKAELDKGDASEFGELQATFPVAGTWPAGEHDLTAAVRFAVCTDETCVPDKRTLALHVTR